MGAQYIPETPEDIGVIPAYLAAIGITTTVDGYGEIGVWDEGTQARIAAKLADGWPESSIVINYLGESETDALTAANGTATPSGNTAALIGLLAASNGSATPSGTVADLLSEGGAAADNGIVNVSGTAGNLIGALTADYGTATPEGIEAELSQAEALAADNGTVTPAGSAAWLVGILASTNGTATPTGTAGELEEAGGGTEATIYANTTDATVGYESLDGSWASVRGNSTGTASVPGITQLDIKSEYLVDYDSEYYTAVARTFEDFTLTSLPGGATITAATLSIYTSNEALGSPKIIVQQGTQAIPPVTGSDYIAFTGASLGVSATIPGVVGYKDIILNAAGLAYLQSVITGTAKLALREYDHDYLNVSPGVGGAHIVFIDSGDSANKPKLVITYTE